MNNLEERLHRTWIQALAEYGYPTLAAIAIDAELSIIWEEVSSWEANAVMMWIDVPLSSYKMFRDNQEIIKKILTGVTKGHVEGEPNLPIEFRVALLEVEEGWKEVVRKLILNTHDPNQAVVIEKAFLRKGKHPLVYNEMKFASKSEIRVAQELENRQVLFFPLPLAVRCHTGVNYKDHREVDFLVCDDGSWGILEVSYHENRYEIDKEKDAWFKKSGILCIEHYTSERCFKNPKEVVDEFLEILAKHR